MDTLITTVLRLFGLISPRPAYREARVRKERAPYRPRDDIVKT